MRLGGRGTINASILIVAIAACGTGAATTQGDWGLSAVKEGGGMPVVDAAQEPSGDEPWTVPTTTVGGNSSSSGGSSSSGSSSSAGQDSGMTGSSSSGAAACTTCTADTDCASTCGMVPQTGYHWCCVKPQGMCASQSYACGTSGSSSSSGGKSSSSSGAAACGMSGQPCCTGMMCMGTICLMGNCL